MLVFFIFNCILIALNTVESSFVNKPTISMPDGKIIGHYKKSQKKNLYEAYEGIPFALPPIGDLRFEAPQAVDPWPKEIVATTFPPKCIGLTRDADETGDFVEGVEDCLYLNVYVPQNKSTELLPVIFWIYGGGFQYSTIEQDTPKFLIDYGVIVVTSSYRHGSLGFLSTEDEVVPGNMGLKDQAMALKWISKHIKYFGGDPEKISLYGQSAGGASVHFHYLSPMSAGLFHTGISLSGVTLNCWVQTEKSRDKAIKLAEIMRCPTKNITDMINCLKTQPARDIVDAQAYFMPWHRNPFTPFGPVVEKPHENAFIDRPPIDIITSGDAYDAPWITGVVSEEGLYPVGEFASDSKVLKDLDINLETIAPHLLDYYYTAPKEDHAKIAQKIRKHYFDKSLINKENNRTLSHMVGDRIFSYDAQKAAIAQAKANKSPVWFYYYSYQAKNSLYYPMNDPCPNPNLGVSHADDSFMVIGNPFIDPTKDEKDYQMHLEMIKFWVSVAETGFPAFKSEWTAVDPKAKELSYMHIKGAADFMMESDDNFAERKFWDLIKFNEN